MKTSSKERSLVLLTLGIVFLILSALTLLQAVAAWHFEHLIIWGVLGYGILDLLIAIGFLTQEKWLVGALAANLTATTVIAIAKFIVYGLLLSTLTSLLFALIINAVVFTAAYFLRERMRDTVRGRYAGYLFAALWLTLFCYTIVVLFV